MTATLRLLLTAALLVFAVAPSAFAACSAGTGGSTLPAGVAGQLAYDTDDTTVYFCNDIAWLSTKGTRGTSCGGTPGGRTRYSSNLHEFCNGTYWYSMQGTSMGTTCAGEGGKMQYASSKLQVCNGTNWYDTTASGYFVLFWNVDSGNIGGLSGANTWCLSTATGGAWLPAKVDASERELLTARKIKAWLCDGSSCQNLQPNTPYKFSTQSNVENGGGSFTTDSSGLGPQDSASWEGATKFCVGDGYGGCITADPYTGRAATGTTLWPNSSHANTCSGWTSTSGSGRAGTTNSTSTGRWSASNQSCAAGGHYLICFVNP